MACLDTTVLVDLLRANRGRKARALKKLAQLFALGETIVTTRFTVAELYLGIEMSADPQESRGHVETVLDHAEAILEFDDRAAWCFGRIAAHLRRQGRPAGDMDLLIAATALVNGHSIVTANAAHFQDMPRLQVETY